MERYLTQIIKQISNFTSWNFLFLIKIWLRIISILSLSEFSTGFLKLVLLSYTYIHLCFNQTKKVSKIKLLFLPVYKITIVVVEIFCFVS